MDTLVPGQVEIQDLGSKVPLSPGPACLAVFFKIPSGTASIDANVTAATAPVVVSSPTTAKKGDRPAISACQGLTRLLTHKGRNLSASRPFHLHCRCLLDHPPLPSYFKHGRMRQLSLMGTVTQRGETCTWHPDRGLMHAGYHSSSDSHLFQMCHC